MPLLHSLLRATAFHNPFLRTLIPSIGLAYGIQAACAIPSILAVTERYYDLSGSLTYISCTALSLYLPTLRARAAAAGAVGVGASAGGVTQWPSIMASLMGKAATSGVNVWNWRQVVLSAAVMIWAARLGSFLFARISGESGRDSRFDGLRESAPKFFGAWMAQATWVSLCLLPVLAVNSLTPAMLAKLPLLMFGDVVGLSLYAGGILLEATADRQKSQWMKEKHEKVHDEGFCTRGLWSKSRHPNYFGEMTLWTGMATVAAGVMTTSPALAQMGLSAGTGGLIGAMAMAYVSPAFVTFLLTKVSGIPMSETKYDKRFENDAGYQKWKKETPVLFPKFW